MKPPNRFARSHFREASSDWTVNAGDEPVDVTAAWLQFKVAREVWAEIAQGRFTVDQLARQLAQSPEAQRKKLSGEQPASLRDLAGWIMVVGDRAYEAMPCADSDLVPATARPLLAGWRSGSGRLPSFGSVTEPDWLRLVSALARDLLAAQRHGQDHLLTSDWIRHRAIEYLDEAGTPPDQLRLRALDETIAVQIGVLVTLVVAVDLVTLDESGDAGRAASAAWRLRAHVRRLAAAGEGGVVVFAALGRLGASVMRDALPNSGSMTEGFTIGPFEAEPRADTVWWTGHEVALGPLAREQPDTSVFVAAIRVLKTTPL